ncbi:enoyl-CoA hydratase/isomerase family protein [Rhodococcus sp. DMU1]|uniref:enoyl-CoA hydratase/isomerase family protein n=1 Tax=Rhodococcus sp. DMU1 TaxID=2722825 RepID=UPI00143EA1F2|nr:enoyl-CoA hydratase/isomerase family protein [Rhodococcus sp. DMU1]QIX53746.1 enoyl-CoA hydratase/isomerase family protein [Rhodococcus sp. DMU1]
MAEEPEIIIESDGPVRIVTLNRPESRNATSVTMHHAFLSLWRQLADDPEARSVVVTGAGKAFSAGGDYEMMQLSLDPVGRWRNVDEARRLLVELVHFPLPIVAAVNGPAVGLGASFLAFSDFVVMAESAFIADPHIAVGLVCGDGGVAWPLHVGLLRAKEMLLLGGRIGAEEAKSMGIANRVVSTSDVLAEATAIAHRLAAQPAGALQDTKRALNLYLESSLAGPVGHSLMTERYSMASDEHRTFVEGQTKS